MSSESSAVEEEAGVLKSGTVTAGFTPIKSKKCYYAVLCERALELHDSEKSQKKKRHARHLIDLSTCFNIDHHLDGRLKYCVSVMTPDETLLLRGETDAICNEWFDVLMAAVIPARALRLGRPVLASEFFECAWDVVLVENPKLKKPVPNPEKMQNLCKRNPALVGAQRLCFYPHTIIMCKRGIEPASYPDVPSSGIPPFRASDFVEFPRKYVASFGCQEKFFIMRMGRSSPSGSAEVWAQCDSEEIAADIHNKLNKIIERETEKKKQMVNGPMLRASISATNHLHHERLHSMSSRHRMGSDACMSESERLKERRAQLRDTKAAVESLEEMIISSPPATPLFVFDVSNQRSGRISSPGSFSSGSRGVEGVRRKVSGTSMRSNGSSVSGPSLPIRSHSITTPSSAPAAPATSVFRSVPRRSEVINEEIPLGTFSNFDISRHRASIASSSAAEETEDSGGTLRIMDADEQSLSSKTANEREIAATIERMLPDDLKDRCSLHLGCFDGHQRRSEGDERNDAGSFSAGCSSSTNDEFISSTPGDTSEDASGDNLEYAPMEMNSCSSGSTSHLAVPIPFEQQYNLEEVRSYVSDSSDSCYSSLAPNGAPRTYSFGSHISQPQRHQVRKHHMPDDGSPLQESVGSTSMQSGVHQRGMEANLSLVNSQEDPRKRAFSLGSKSWFQKPFRKFSRDLSSRTHRHSNNSAASLASSYGAPSGHAMHPSSASSVQPIQAYIAPDPHPYSRVRSESIGSGQSTPYTHRSNGVTATDHVQLDFGGGNAPLGRSASGSVHSIESPTRSRTSSFGCSQRFAQSVRDPGEIVIHAIDVHETESSFCHPHMPSSRERPPAHFHQQAYEEDEYVDRDVGMEDDYVLSDRVLHELVGEACGFPPCSSIDTQIINAPVYTDSRSSQIFETIQENISGRSSPVSVGSHEEEEGKGNWSARAVKGSNASVNTRELDEQSLTRESDVENWHECDTNPTCSSPGNGEEDSSKRPMRTNSHRSLSQAVTPLANRSPPSPASTQNPNHLKCRDDSDLRYVLVDLVRPPGMHKRKRSKSSSICSGVRPVEYAQLQPMPSRTLM